MPYNNEIEARIGKITARWKNMSKKKMFGGICYLLNGNMAFGIYKDFLILRLGEEKGSRALESEHVRFFDITGRPMKGWVMVEMDGFKNDDDLKAWLKSARDFAGSLQPK